MTFDKKQYYTGETAKVSIHTDATMCKKDIKGFKFRLMRRHWAKDTGYYKWCTTSDRYMETEEAKGMDKGTEKTFEMTLRIPTEDDFKDDSGVPEEHAAMLKSFSSTVEGKIIQVDYYLKVFIQFHAWNDWGEGKSCSLPIDVLQPPIQYV